MWILKKYIYQDSRTAYLVIEPEADINNSLSMNMMKNNKIQCLLDMEYRYIDNNIALYYKIQGLQCLKEYIGEYNLDYNMTRQLYLDIVQAVINGEEFFLNENSYVLDLEYIYWDKKSKRAKLCCVPEWHGDFQKDIKKLSEDIIIYINHSDKAAEKFIYGIYGLISDNGFITSDIKSYIKEFKKDETVNNKHSNCNTQKAPAKTIKPDTLNNGYNKISRQYILNIDKISIPFSNYKKGKINICISDICSKVEENSYKISVGRNKKCNIVFPFGFISRYHALIHISDGKIYIEDTDSVNGTYINGQKIPANVKTLCSNSDIISFAGINCCVIVK